ncbi:MAG TPA: Flp pilus assembly protein CpaB [Bryobacteraceae bacterium]|nr:Flp pilus assembly protein CpaB [Bryobacteraceae bacterium]
MKKRLIGVFLFALVVSAGAAFVLYQLISTKVTAGASTHPVTKTVFVAAHDLQPGALITDRDISTMEVVKIPDGAIVKKEDLLNRGVVSPIHQDTAFFDAMLAKKGEGAGFATIIPPGMRALAIKVNEVIGLAGFAVAGMHVDVLVAGTPPSGSSAGPVSRTLLQNITVLSAGQNYQKDAEGKPVMVQVVNLLVTPEQAEILNLATDERIQLVLRNPNDQAVAQTTGAATANLFEGTNIRTSHSDGDNPAPRPRQKAAPQPPPAPVVAPPAAPPPPPKTSVIEVLSGATRTQVTVSNVPSQDQEARQ